VSHGRCWFWNFVKIRHFIITQHCVVSSEIHISWTVATNILITLYMSVLSITYGYCCVRPLPDSYTSTEMCILSLPF
jgi:hypothetical protein